MRGSKQAGMAELKKALEWRSDAEIISVTKPYPIKNDSLQSFDRTVASYSDDDLYRFTPMQAMDIRFRRSDGSEGTDSVLMAWDAVCYHIQRASAYSGPYYDDYKVIRIEFVGAYAITRRDEDEGWRPENRHIKIDWPYREVPQYQYFTAAGIDAMKEA